MTRKQNAGIKPESGGGRRLGHRSHLKPKMGTRSLKDQLSLVARTKELQREIKKQKERQG